MLIRALIIAAGSQPRLDSNLGLGLGIVPVGFVLLVPQGLVPVIRTLALRLVERRIRGRPASGAGGAALATERAR